MMSRALFAAFDAWSLRLSEAVVERNRDYSCRKAVLRMSQRRMTRSFLSWQQTGMVLKIFRQKMRKACLTWVLNIHKRALQSWRETSACYTRIRRTETQLTRRLRSRTIRKNWICWLTVAARERRARRGVARLIARLGHKIESKAMTGWAFNCKDVRRRRKVVCKAVWNMRGLLQHKAWLTWQVHEVYNATASMAPPMLSRNPEAA